MKIFVILLIFCVSFESFSSMSYVSIDKEKRHLNSISNSDEERFYIDESSWDTNYESPSSRALPKSNENKESRNSDKKSYENVVVKVGRKAILPCFVNDLGSFKVIWAKSGDILSLGSIKINDDNRLKIQHRYISEWHLVIENVVTDDEGEYICKTNGNFYKIIKLQVLMPPTMNDLNSIPAGTINLKEGSTLSLKCFAEGKPEPTVRWYRWKKYKHLESSKEELSYIGNEITIMDINRNDPNTYECIAKNSVPPATSRIFNIEIHFLPIVALSKKLDVTPNELSLECLITSNPLDKVYWYRNGQILNDEHRHEKIVTHDNYNIATEDVSSLYELYKTLLTLTITNAQVDDFGEYQCCAMNAYGQICSRLHVKVDHLVQSITHQPTTIEKLASTKAIHTLFWSEPQPPKLKAIDAMNTNSRAFGSHKLTSKHSESNRSMNQTVTNNSSTEDKRRQYLKRKQFLHLDSKASHRSISCVSTNLMYLIVISIIGIRVL